MSKESYGTGRGAVKPARYIVNIGGRRVRIRATFWAIHAMLRGIMAQRQEAAA